MPGKIKLAEVPINASVDPSVAEAMRQLITNTSQIAAQVDSDVVTFASTGAVETLSHRLGRAPRYFRVLKKDGAADLYATAANSAQWTAMRIVLTSTAAGTNFTIEVF